MCLTKNLFSLTRQVDSGSPFRPWSTESGLPPAPPSAQGAPAQPSPGMCLHVLYCIVITAPNPSCSSYYCTFLHIVMALGSLAGDGSSWLWSTLSSVSAPQHVHFCSVVSMCSSHARSTAWNSIALRRLRHRPFPIRPLPSSEWSCALWGNFMVVCRLVATSMQDGLRSRLIHLLAKSRG